MSLVWRLERRKRNGIGAWYLCERQAGLTMSVP
jgi:hypothetical protein